MPDYSFTLSPDGPSTSHTAMPDYSFTLSPDGPSTSHTSMPDYSLALPVQSDDATLTDLLQCMLLHLLICITCSSKKCLHADDDLTPDGTDPSTNPELVMPDYPLSLSVQSDDATLTDGMQIHDIVWYIQRMRLHCMVYTENGATLYGIYREWGYIVWYIQRMRLHCMVYTENEATLYGIYRE